jgi:ABC-type lipoprotein export system ATPase subunit
MQIRLQQVTPDFIEEEKIARSQVWNSNLVFQAGEKVLIIAPSGNGKTSLIHFLYGLRRNYSGNILFDGKNISDFDAGELATYRRQFTGIVFQDLRLFPDQTVLQNIEVKRQLCPYHAESKITEMANRLGIGSKLNKPCSTCSYGEQQRIAIIRALQQPYDLLLLDEPFSHLDEKNLKMALELVEEETHLRKAAIIFAELGPFELFKPTTVLYL